MAASLWIESHVRLKRNRKLCELARTLKVRRSYIAGVLHFIWHEAIENQEDGDLTNWTDEEIAEAGDFPLKRAAELVAALQNHRFLDGRIIHDWLDHAGLLLRQRYAKRQREKLVEIWAKHGRDYGSTESQQDANPKSTSPNRTVPNPPTNHSSAKGLGERLKAKTPEAK